MPATCALLISLGEVLPGIAAVVMIRSDAWICCVRAASTLALFLGGQRAGVAALAGGVDAGVDEGGAERERLFLGGRPHVVAFDDGAQALGGGDRFEARDAQAHHQHLGWADDAGGRGDLGQHASHMGRAEGTA